MATPEQVKEYARMAFDKYPSSTNLLWTLDGLKVMLEVAGEDAVQNKYYNGWKRNHFISNLFVFPTGGQIYAACQFHGLWWILLLESTSTRP